MTKYEAEQIIRGEKTYDEVDSQPSSEMDLNSSVDNTTSSATETAPVEKTSDNEQVDTLPKEETVVSSDNTDSLEKVEDNVQNKKKSYTPEEKQRHAFMKEKNKRKEIQSKLDAKQKEIEELQEKLKKYEGLTKEHFKGDDDAYTDYKIDRRYDQEKVERLQKEYDEESYRAQMEEAQQIADYRLQTNYPDENERNQYQNLVMRAESDFATLHPEIGYEKFSEFLKSEKDRTIIQYLQDSDNSPKLIRHFIHKPEVALKIMTMRNPYNKIVELKQLENRMLQFERMKSISNVKIQPTKKELPNTGKVVSNSNNKSQLDYDRPWSKKECEEWLRNHK